MSFFSHEVSKNVEGSTHKIYLSAGIIFVIGSLMVSKHPDSVHKTKKSDNLTVESRSTDSPDVLAES